ncbi:MAG: hypothetical protein R3F13_21140 [Prosthecobacter sp.]
MKTVHAEQGDLKSNGEFFSMMLIFLINAFLLIGLFLAASPLRSLGFGEVMRCWWSVFPPFSAGWGACSGDAAGLCPQLCQIELDA